MLDEGVAMIFFIAIFCAQKVKPARCRDLSFGKVNYAEKACIFIMWGEKAKAIARGEVNKPFGKTTKTTTHPLNNAKLTLHFMAAATLLLLLQLLPPI